MSRFKEERKFGFTIGSAFLVLSIILFTKKSAIAYGVSGLGVIILLLAVFLPSSLKVVKIFWDKIGRVIGYINTILLLSLLYWIVITPIGLLLRILGKDPLELKFNNKVETYWKSRVSVEQTQFNKQF